MEGSQAIMHALIDGGALVLKEHPECVQLTSGCGVVVWHEPTLVLSFGVCPPPQQGHHHFLRTMQLSCAGRKITMTCNSV